jgi:hypothetical protein
MSKTTRYNRGITILALAMAIGKKTPPSSFQANTAIPMKFPTNKTASKMHWIW